MSGYVQWRRTPSARTSSCPLSLANCPLANGPFQAVRKLVKSWSIGFARDARSSETRTEINSKCSRSRRPGRHESLIGTGLHRSKPYLNGMKILKPHGTTKVKYLVSRRSGPWPFGRAELIERRSRIRNVNWNADWRYPVYRAVDRAKLRPQ